MNRGTPLAVALASEDLIRLSVGMNLRTTAPAPVPVTPTAALKHARRHKRYATLILPSRRSNSGRSSDMSSASVYTTSSSTPRERKFSAAQEVAAKCRAQWAAMETMAAASSVRRPDTNVPSSKIQDELASAVSASSTLLARRPSRHQHRDERERPLPPQPLEPPALDVELDRTPVPPKPPTIVSPLSTTLIGGVQGGELYSRPGSQTCVHASSPLSPQLNWRQSHAAELEGAVSRSLSWPPTWPRGHNTLLTNPYAAACAICRKTRRH